MVGITNRVLRLTQKWYKEWGQSMAFDAVIGPFAAFYGLNVSRPSQRSAPGGERG